MKCVSASIRGKMWRAGISANLLSLGGLAISIGMMIDASHANSSKQPERQPLVLDDVGRQIAAGDRRIVGVMVESNLVAGRQDLIPGKPLTYGQSITDGCIGWDTSVGVLDRLADAVEERRRVSGRRVA